ncbi:sugar ABC transporter permease [Mycoplasma buteonis]|uniref:sugar ABC transporter permease n=1 Tax=Mycoplasma buteonis TaxID=171280 RepID=UPI00056BDC4C|nr:sugar ABC transporter permease [Mycoplasma buteonis]
MSNKFYKFTFDNVKVSPERLAPKRIKFNESDTKPPTAPEIIWLFFNYVILVGWAIVILFPIVSLIIAAFNTSNPRYISLTPFKFGFDNLVYLFTSEKSHFGTWYLNTFIIAIATSIISTVAVALNGYAYSRFKFAGSKHSLTVIMLIQMIPATSSLIVLYMLVTLGNSIKIPPIVVLIFIYAGGAIAGNTFMVKSYLDTVSTELDDSAKVDGCGNWGVFFKVLIPVILPALIMVALWSFLIPFTDIILPQFVLADITNTTLAVGLQSFLNNQQDVQAGAYAIGTILASIPPFILFMYLQKYIVGGLSDGAVKG